MIKSYSVGEDIEAWCTNCKLELDHTITAMVDNLPKKVECNTCKGKHNYRAKPSERTRTKTRTTVRKVRKSITEKYNEVLSGLSEGDLSNAIKYSIKGNFEKDDIIDHSKRQVEESSRQLDDDALQRDLDRTLEQNRRQMEDNRRQMEQLRRELKRR